MAGDSVGVLDHLGIEQAHIVGASMGGMIAQTIAIRYPERTLSLVSIMSNTGSFWSGQPALALYAVLLKPAPRERDGVHPARRRHVHQDRRLRLRARRRGPARHRHAARMTAGTTRSGSLRQLAAIIADRDRAPALRKLRVPATVIHGAEDKLVRPLRRARDGEGDPRRDAGRDRGHGPRPAARRVADDHRRDRADRRARAGAYTSKRMSTTTSSSRITPPVIARPCH